MESEPVVYVVDDDEAVRDSLRWLVESVGLRVRALESAAQFLREYDPDLPGCLVLDVRMPGESGLELQTQLAKQNVSIPVIIVTGHADVQMAVQAMKTGAVDFVEKPLNYQMLLDRIQRAIMRDREQRQRDDEKRQIVERLDRLSPREREVLEHVVDGKLNKQIADVLSISPKTVEMHRSHLMKKMEAESLAALVRMVMIARDNN